MIRSPVEGVASEFTAPAVDAVATQTPIGPFRLLVVSPEEEATAACEEEEEEGKGTRGEEGGKEVGVRGYAVCSFIAEGSKISNSLASNFQGIFTEYTVKS